VNINEQTPINPLPTFTLLAALLPVEPLAGTIVFVTPPPWVCVAPEPGFVVAAAVDKVEVFDTVLEVTGVPAAKVKPQVFDTVAGSALTHTSMTHSTAIF
jgi:hypothetical protein